MDIPVANCHTCGVSPRGGARFCDGCGSPLEQGHPSAEYKQVTVLFADVTRSMKIAAVVGPERLREIMTAVFDGSAAVVQRYGGTVDKFIGDGIMALFGAPVALEDHAIRACLAALDVQVEARRLAIEFAERDGINLQVRVGLNSGEVIAGEIGSKTMSYTVIGEQVGMAQRMESAAPPGGVMISESTARLVAHAATLGEPQLVAIKGATVPVPARRLLEVPAEHHWMPRRELTLVGREREVTELRGWFDRAIGGQGCVIEVKGAPGVGKSRITREVAVIAADRQIDVIWTYCESHTSGIPFRNAAALLRGFFGISNLGPTEARARMRASLPEADEDDLALLDDLIGIRDGELPGVSIDPDARRRRLTALLHTALLTRGEPAVYVVEDAHWMDGSSESLLSDFIAAAPRAPAMVLITYRPEYVGVLTASADRTMSLAPLDDTQAATLVDEILGNDPSVAQLARRIAERAAGNPFFTEEIVRDLVERHVLVGNRGAHLCRTNAEVTVPATVQSTIAARIDRLATASKRTLGAASVIGARFGAALLASLLDDVALDELIRAELIEQVADAPAEYSFKHPLMQTVAYESQLKSDRAQLHRAIAAAIQEHDVEAVEENSALIATHLEAASDLHQSYGWHMRAGTWSTHRDIAAARVSWKRAVAVADRLPTDDPDRSPMRIAPRTFLCATAWRVGGDLADTGFDELRELTTAVGDKQSLAMGMTGLVQMMNLHGKFSVADSIASEHVELLESLGNPALTVGLLTIPIVAKWDVGDMSEAMRLSQRAIDLAAGNPTMGNLIIGSPLAFMLALRASARCCLSIPGWREDFDDAVEMSRDVDPFTHSTVLMIKFVSTLNWALLPDDAALDEMAKTLRMAEQIGDNFQLANARFTLGLALVRGCPADRDRGFELLHRVRDTALQHRYIRIAALCVDLDDAVQRIGVGDFDNAVDLCRGVLDYQRLNGEGINRGWATSVLVDALLKRGGETDIEAAQASVDELAAMQTEPVFLYHELPLLRMTALIARARGDEDHYCDYRDRYRARAEAVGFDGHIQLASAMD